MSNLEMYLYWSMGFVVGIGCSICLLLVWSAILKKKKEEKKRR